MMTIRVFAFAVLAFSAVRGVAQTEVIVKDTVQGRTEKIEVPPSMATDLDRNSLNPIEKETLQQNPDCDTATYIPVYSPEVYKQRLMQIPSVVELPYNGVVQQFIDRYTTDLRNSVSFMLGVSNFYMPIFEQALETEGVPLDLRFLPVIESALNPTAVSRVGAKGLWQFMITTGKKYGLTINSLVDERCDPVKSSYAAAAYLKHLYTTYGDWTLAIAAYNCGERQVDKAIRRSKGVKDYWVIYNKLPEETRGYVPAFIAANYIMNFYCEHNICPMKAKLPSETDTLTITRNLNMQQIAAMFHVDVERLRALNPQYRTDLIPGNSLPCTLRLPVSLVDKFIDAGDSIYTYEVSGYKPRRVEVQIGGGQKTVVPARVQAPADNLRENRPAATRKEEDTTDSNSIESALRKTSAGNVDETEIKESRSSNKRSSSGRNTSRSTSSAADKREERTSSKRSTSSKEVASEKTSSRSGTSSRSSKRSSAGETSSKRSSSKKSSDDEVSSKKSSSKGSSKKSSKKGTQATGKSSKSKKKKEASESHTVKSGDTLSELAEKYNTTVSKLKKMNNIKGNTIQSGKKIKVK